LSGFLCLLFALQRLLNLSQIFAIFGGQSDFAEGEMIIPCQKVEVGENEASRGNDESPLVDVLADVFSSGLRLIHHDHLETGGED